MAAGQRGLSDSAVCDGRAMLRLLCVCVCLCLCVWGLRWAVLCTGYILLKSPKV